MKKGFTTVELIVTFALSLTIAIFLFQIILLLKNLYTSYGLKTELLNKQSLLSYQINDEFNNKKINTITKCGHYCLNFLYVDGSVSQLYIDIENKTIDFNNNKTIFPNGTYFKDIDINVYISPVFDAYKNDSLVMIDIPVYNDSIKDENFGIKTVYQYNSLSSNITKVVFDEQASEYGTVILKGATQMSISNIDSYKELGFLVLDKDGNLVDQSLVTVDNPLSSMTLPYKFGKYDIKYHYKDTLGNIIETKTRTITVKEKEFIDSSGANQPILFSKMIPVIYDGTDWIMVEETQSKWYSYDEKAWANAVVLNDGITKNVGDIINVDTEVAMMYVWIPRYKYTIFNGNDVSAPVQEIKINFESGTAKTGTVTCTTATSGSGTSSETCSIITNGVSTYTHPAFTFGTQELTGMWVGKFENSTTDIDCNTNQSGASCNKVLPVTIKPNVRSWRIATVSNFYTSIGNISTNYGMNVDSHMMKNMEWGAVAYLTQSKYGRCNSGTCLEISKNDSSDYYTGRSQGMISPTSSYSASGTYTYEVPLGQLASTTGNIYGIYDMSGGAGEYVMGNMVNSSNQFYNSSAGFSTNPLNKYYDSYTYDTSNVTHSRGRLGDATKETLQTFGSNTGGWYSDYANFTYSTGVWFGRGGDYNQIGAAGIFYFNDNNGTAYNIRAARTVIVATN